MFFINTSPRGLAALLILVALTIPISADARYRPRPHPSSGAFRLPPAALITTIRPEEVVQHAQRIFQYDKQFVEQIEQSLAGTNRAPASLLREIKQIHETIYPEIKAAAASEHAPSTANFDHRKTRELVLENFPEPKFEYEAPFYNLRRPRADIKTVSVIDFIPRTNEEFAAVYNRRPSASESDALLSLSQRSEAQTKTAITDLLKVIETSSNDVVVFLGHNESGRLVSPAGGKFTLTELARSCYLAHKLCVFLACESRQDVAPFGAIGTRRKISAQDAIDASEQIILTAALEAPERYKLWRIVKEIGVLDDGKVRVKMMLVEGLIKGVIVILLAGNDEE